MKDGLFVVFWFFGYVVVDGCVGVGCDFGCGVGEIDFGFVFGFFDVGGGDDVFVFCYVE